MNQQGKWEKKEIKKYFVKTEKWMAKIHFDTKQMLKPNQFYDPCKMYKNKYIF